VVAVSDERLKGNYGVAAVMARLSAECLVRPVAADTDIGVDLYCETVQDGQAFLHFWVQVKAGAQCRVKTERGVASCDFDSAHLDYWRRQPVPVFAALVPTEWPVQREPSIYLVDVTTQLLNGHVRIGQQTVRLRSDYCWEPGHPEAVRTLLRETVPATTARLQVSNGVVAGVPTIEPRYEGSAPRVPVLSYRQEIRDQLRRTAALSVWFALEANAPLTDEDKDFHRLLARIVKSFVDVGDFQWENFYSLGLSRHADEDYEGAETMYIEARKSIERDEKVRDKPKWQGIKRIVDERARRAHSQLALHPAASDDPTTRS
jgi:hypothetical protein